MPADDRGPQQMSTDYLSPNTTLNDHDLTLAIPGDVGSVQQRLTKAVQALGYKVLAEQPLYAKRGGQSWARWDCSLNVLEYPTTLTISLKQMNDVAVVVNFSYEIKSCMHMTKGDRQTLVREAEAIAALATERLGVSACPACGTRITDESHFCRRCGAPLVLDLPELEVLRLTRESRASYHNILIGALVLFLAALTILPIFVVNGARIFGPLFWMGIPLGSYAFYLLFRGMWQLHYTLNPKPLKNAIARSQPAFPTSITTALPPARANASVIEGTTELLSSTNEHREAEPIRRKDADTAEIDNERLM
jgi:zinc-ribbon domain